MPIEQISEITIQPGPMQVDNEASVIRGVKILGAVSRNQRTYAEGVMQRAIPLYEGIKVNINHPKGSADQPRDYRDRFGILENVHFRDNGIYADLKFNPKHNIAEQFVWDAQNAPGNVGLSHNIEARTKRGENTLVIEEILSVISVDLVGDPATTVGLFESQNSPEQENDTMTLEKLTLDELRSSRPDLCDKLREEVLSSSDDAAKQKAVTEENQALKKELDGLKALQEAAKRTASIDKLLSEAGIKPVHISVVFRQQLESATSDKDLQALIEDRKKIIGLTEGSRSNPTSAEQQPQGTSGDLMTVTGPEDFAGQIRG